MQYRIKLFQAVDGTDTEWLLVTGVDFETDEPLINVQSAVLDVKNDFVTEEETEGPEGKTPLPMEPTGKDKLQE